MRKIREILLNEYIGAITIGLILADAVTRIISGVVQTANLYWESSHSQGSMFMGKPQFSWFSLVLGVFGSVLYLLVAWLLLRWLFFTAPHPTEDKGVAEDQ